jgi:hypothetical protein
MAAPVIALLAILLGLAALLAGASRWLERTIREALAEPTQLERDVRRLYDPQLLAEDLRDRVGGAS